ncbi:MAG TPA: aminodeoxychorismate/anthranilate synthase component II [Polyangiaceae bacterium]|nr:aminodeoxychorismate/anthranilate synthase component II [Polyangiaceae bacterium]
MPGSARRRAAVRVLIVDNYDSFTYNTVQLLELLGARCEVHLNDGISLSEIEQLDPQGLLLSAGPGTPDEAGITLAAIRHFAGRLPVLGVCLGHQAIAQAFGARVVRAARPMHGKVCAVAHDGQGLFEGLPRPALMARYNSLLVDESSLPGVVHVTARSETGEVMAVAHGTWPVQGVQFHPESVLSESGARLLDNWLAQL